MTPVTLKDLIVDRLRQKISSDVGQAVRAGMGETLENLHQGAVRKLRTAIAKQNVGEVDEQRLPDLEYDMIGRLADKLLDNIFLPDLQGKTIITAPSTIQQLNTLFSALDEEGLEMMSQKEITATLQGSKKKASPSASAEQDDVEELKKAATRTSTPSKPKTTSTPRPTQRPTTRSWNGK